MNTLAELARMLPAESFFRSNVEPITDAEALAEHADPEGPLKLFLEFGPCQCEQCEREIARRGSK